MVCLPCLPCRDPLLYLLVELHPVELLLLPPRGTTPPVHRPGRRRCQVCQLFLQGVSSMSPAHARGPAAMDRGLMVKYDHPNIFFENKLTKEVEPGQTGVPGARAR